MEVQEKLQEVYEEKGVVLALGAGVSKKSELPDWEKLIKGLGDRLKKKDELSVFDTLKADGFGLPAIAGVIEALYSASRKDFAKAIQDQLYLKFPFHSEINEANREAFVKYVGRNKTLRAIAALCALKQEDGSYTVNPRLHAIATTNVDSVLRSYISERYYGSHLARSIDRASAGRIYGRIPIYYLHGFIRFDRDIKEVNKHAADLRVFTEQEFFDFFGNPYSLYNYTFLYLLREFYCVFVGMSLKDDNVRRLLHYAKKERFESDKKELFGLHEREIKNDDKKKEELEAKADEKGRRHFLITEHPKKNGKRDERLAELTEISLKRLGVNVLWLDSFAEIPGLFRELYESTSPHFSWDEVYDLN